MKCTQKLAFKVISKITWHTKWKYVKIYKDNPDEDADYHDQIRDLTEEELSAVVSHDCPLRIKADFDGRAFPEPSDYIEFVDWTLELKPGCKYSGRHQKNAYLWPLGVQATNSSTTTTPDGHGINQRKKKTKSLNTCIICIFVWEHDIAY
jgi:hypothetical protein